MTGIELLEKLRSVDDELPVVLMTAFGTVDTAVKAMKMGAFDYLTKPFEGDELLITVKRAVEHRRLMRENALLRAAGNGAAGNQGPTPVGVSRLIGNSDAMKRLRDQVSTIAASQGTVLVTGESGVGKEVVARALHEAGPRSPGPFLAVNCAALSPALLESELFGHERGAFTGAERLRKGRFELSDGGTLLLDEVSEIAPAIQAKLLRVLQERCFERVGSSLSIGVDVRMIATSNRDLPAACAKGEFRQDLYFRLSVLPISVPPLRERREDIPDLCRHFLAQICRREGRGVAGFTEDALRLLQDYSWPGNVRELQNICERAVVLGARDGSSDLPRDLIEPWVRHGAAAPTQQIEAKPQQHHAGTPQRDDQDVIKTLEELERETIVQTLHMFKGHRQRTAVALGIGVRTLGLKLKKWKELQLVAESL